MVESAGEILNIKIRETELHFQVAGVSKEDSKKIIRISCTQGNFPEPLRVAHLIASAYNEKRDQ